MLRDTALLIMAVGMLLPGCRSVGQRTLRDTEGRHFEARCDREQNCTLKQTAGPKVSGLASEAVLRSPGALVGVCNVEPASEPEAPSDCRALECDGDQHCPPAHGAKDGHCVNGLCREPANRLGMEDAVMLCLSGTGLGRDSDLQVARYAMALNCGTPCAIPAPCRQP